MMYMRDYNYNLRIKNNGAGQKLWTFDMDNQEDIIKIVQLVYNVTFELPPADDPNLSVVILVDADGVFVSKNINL